MSMWLIIMGKASPTLRLSAVQFSPLLHTQVQVSVVQVGAVNIQRMLTMVFRLVLRAHCGFWADP